MKTTNFDPGRDEEQEPEGYEENSKLSNQDRIKGLAPLHAALSSQELFNKDGSTKKILRAKKIDWIRNLIWLDGAKFNFDGRGYLVSIYNQKCRKRLLKCGRQVEKCLGTLVNYSLADGRVKKCGDSSVGDEVVALDILTGRQIKDIIVASESNGEKECVTIRTRLGNEFTCTLNHPLLKFNGWVQAGELKVGDKIAGLRTQGFFGNINEPNAFDIGVGSSQKLPDDVFSYDVKSTGNLLRGLLESCKTRIDLEFELSCKELAIQIKLLLRKFGIISHLLSYPHKNLQLDKHIIRIDVDHITSYKSYCSLLNFNFAEEFNFTSDIIWEEIEGITPAGVLPTWAIQTKTQTFVSENIVQHNSTMLGNEIVINSAIIPYHRSLYVSPSHDQSRQFSNGKLKPYIEDSPLIKKYLQSSSVSKQVFEKSMTNGSIIFLRSAFLNADRARGITARLLCVSGDALIYTENGTMISIKKFISDCRVGERIWTLNEKTYKPELKRVLSAHINGFKNLVKVTTSSGLEVRVTPDHKIMTWGGWKEAQNLDPSTDYILESAIIPSDTELCDQNLSPDNDKQLLKKTNKNIRFSKVKSVVEDNNEMVFDLSLEDNHNFFANGILIHNCLDEVQNILVSNIPVIEECMSHEEDPLEIMSGTPLTLENPLEQYWQMSSQCEWLVPCHHHYPKHWNFLDEKCIGKTGPICNKCGNPINPAEGKWYAFSDTKEIMGYRISQLMVPWMYRKQEKWKDLIWKYENYSQGQFYNEVLGISYDSATKPVTRMELMACCSEKYPFLYEPSQWSHQMELFAGVDWGEGSDGSERNPKGKIKNASYTVLSIGAYIDPVHFHYFYYRRFEGQEASPEFCLAEIIRTLQQFRVRAVGVDWGHGWGMNDRLEHALGPKRVIKFQYVGNQKERKKFDPIGIKIQLARNEVMSDFILDIKDKKIVWPAWGLVSKFLVDIENIYQEYNEYQRTVKYDHLPSNPDDAMHSSIYCREAADIYFNKSR